MCGALVRPHLLALVGYASWYTSSPTGHASPTPPPTTSIPTGHAEALLAAQHHEQHLDTCTCTWGHVGPRGVAAWLQPGCSLVAAAARRMGGESLPRGLQAAGCRLQAAAPPCCCLCTGPGSGPPYARAAGAPVRGSNPTLCIRGCNQPHALEAGAPVRGRARARARARIRIRIRVRVRVWGRVGVG